MSIPTEGKLLRIFVGEADHWHGKPLYEAIVLEARKRGLAGATVVVDPSRARIRSARSAPASVRSMAMVTGLLTSCVT